MRKLSVPAIAVSRALILTSALLAALSVFGCAAPSSTIQTRTHVDEEAGFQIDYPVDWKRSTQTEDAAAAGGTVATVAFSAPMTSDSKAAPPGVKPGESAETASVTVIAERLAATDDVDLDEYSERGLEQLPKVVKGMDIIDEGRTELAGFPARHLTYTGDLGDRKPTWRQVWAMSNGRVFILTYVGMGSAFKRHEEEFDAMTKSFKVFEPNR